jgi:hypothetical protein
MNALLEQPPDPFNAALKALNSAYDDDPSALHALICNRVPCNEKLANHPTVQVSVNELTNTPNPTYVVGMLGIINGILDAALGKRIAAIIDDRGKVTGFCEFKNDHQS